ncbi:hypothetical protein [Paenibacillus xylanexedens]|nr:hypothetical protein [Paenibacillus xylanexedens]
MIHEVVFDNQLRANDKNKYYDEAKLHFQFLFSSFAHRLSPSKSFAP